MTNPHAKAVEAAVFVLQRTSGRAPMSDCITTYLAAMRAEGWVMVRDCGEATAPLGDTTKPTDVRLALEDAYEDGWNEARAAMLGGNDDER
jgi:hypothetical protein